MASEKNLNAVFTDIANAIREKKGTAEQIKPINMAEEIVNLPSGGGGNTLKALLDVTKSCHGFFYEYSGTSVEGLFSYSDTSSVTTTNYMFGYCPSLTTIPLFDTSNVTNMSSMFYQSPSLTTIPKLDTGNVTNMNYMFGGCKALTTIPQLNTSSVTNMSSMFSDCYKLTTIPLIDTSKATNMNSMFSGCSYLTDVPLFDTSNVTDMNYMFNGCSKLTTIPKFNTSKITSMASMLKSSGITTIPQLDTSNVTNMSSMFDYCRKLTSVPQLDVSKVTSMRDMFFYCTSLKSILMTGMKVSFDIHWSTQFEESDLVTVLNNLATVTSTQTLTMGSTNLAKLTDEEKAIATNKGWTLA